jgi:hypothetical protein
LDRGLGGPQSRSGRGSEEKNSQPLQGFETPIIQPIAQSYTSELTRLHIKYRRITSSYIIAILKTLLTSWFRDLLEKLTVIQLTKKFPHFYGTGHYPQPVVPNPYPHTLLL